MIRGSNPGIGKGFWSSPERPEGFWNPPCLLFNTLSRRKSGWSVKETFHLHSVLRTIGATPLLPLYALVGCTGQFHHFHLLFNTYFRIQPCTSLSVHAGSQVTDCVVSTFTAGSTVADSNCCSSATVSPCHRRPKRTHSDPKAGKRSEFWWKLQIQVDLKCWPRNDHLYI